MSKKVLLTATVQSHIAQFHKPLMRLLKEKGYCVHVAAKNNLAEKNGLKIEYADEVFDLPFSRSPRSMDNIRAYKQLKKIIKENNYDIIHCNTPMGGVVTRVAARKVRKHGTKVFYTAHGFHFYQGAPIQNWLLYYPIERILSRCTDILITINQEDYSLAKTHMHAKYIEYIHGVGVDFKRLDGLKKANDFKKVLNIPQDAFVICSVGELNKGKNHETVIRALSQIKNENIYYCIAGNGPLESDLKDLCSCLGVSERVKFLGYTSQIDLLFGISSVFVFPSLREGLSVALMEAMAAGLPVVCSQIRGNVDLIEHGKGGFLYSPKDADGFAEGICKLMRDAALCQSMGEKNKANVQKFSADSVDKELDNIYTGERHIPQYVILPMCSDLNRGDQALVWETKAISVDSGYNGKYYFISNSEKNSQTREAGIEPIVQILNHPARVSDTHNNIRYNLSLKLKWGFRAIGDFFSSMMLLNGLTRAVWRRFLNEKKQHALKIIEQSDGCFVKGGGFIHAYGGITAWYYIYYVLYHIILAQSLGKPVYILPNSFGPFNGVCVAKIIRKVLKRCEFIASRESISAAMLKKHLGISVKTYPDLGFFLEKNQISQEEFFRQFDIDRSRKTVALTMRPYRFPQSDNPQKKYDDFKQTMTNMIHWLYDQNYMPVIVEHVLAINEHENDGRCIKEVLASIDDEKYRLVSDVNYTCRDLKGIYANCNYIIGTRFHSVIFSLSENVPAIAITYGGNKGKGIMADMGLEKYSVSIEEVDFETLKTMFMDLIENESEVKETIKAYMTDAQEKRKALTQEIKK